MPDDLKTMLGKVLKSQGRKRFNFAFGTGKRKDGKGDGALAVASKKIKESDLKEDCEIAQFYEGACWSSPDGETVYFSGKKKLSSMLVAKMMLSVKKTTGRQYEFALPTPEEENRTANLEEASENDETPEAESQQGEIPVAPPMPTTSEEATAAKARMRALLPKHLRAIQAVPGERNALEQKSAAATAAMSDGDYDAANAALTAWDTAIQRVLEIGTAPDPAAAIAAVKAKLKVLKPALQAAIQGSPQRKAELDATLATANSQANLGKKDEALATMGELEQLIKAVLRNPSAPADNIPAAPPLESTPPQRNGNGEQEQRESENSQQQEGNQENQPNAEQQTEEAEEETSNAPAPDRAEVVRRFNATGPGVRAAVARRGPELQQVQALFAAIKTAIDQQKLTEAVPKLDELEELLARTASAGRAAEAAQVIPVGNVALRKAMLNWKAAFTAAKGEMAKAKALILNDERLKALPENDWKPIEKGAQELNPDLADFDTGLYDAIDDADKATEPGQKLQHYRRAVALITEYETKLSTDPVYVAIDEAYPQVKLHALLSKALTTLATQLRR